MIGLKDAYRIGKMCFLVCHGDIFIDDRHEYHEIEKGTLTLNAGILPGRQGL